MLRALADLKECKILAADGLVGAVSDLYFDDKTWVIRYFVVDTGSWLDRKKVLVSPIVIGAPNWEDRTLPTATTKEQVRHSPDIDTEKPISRLHELQYFGYYGLPNYWGSTGMWGAGAYPNLLMPTAFGLGGTQALVESFARQQQDLTAAALLENEQPQIRSSDEVMGYHLHATDGDIGHIRGMLVDDTNWAIRYLVINASHWWNGHDILIAPSWIESVSWFDRSVYVNQTRQTVKSAPPFNARLPLGRADETEIHTHYGRRAYWDNELNINAP